MFYRLTAANHACSKVSCAGFARRSSQLLILRPHPYSLPLCFRRVRSSQNQPLTSKRLFASSAISSASDKRDDRSDRAAWLLDSGATNSSPPKHDVGPGPHIFDVNPYLEIGQQLSERNTPADLFADPDVETAPATWLESSKYAQDDSPYPSQEQLEWAMRSDRTLETQDQELPEYAADDSPERKSNMLAQYIEITEKRQDGLFSAPDDPFLHSDHAYWHVLSRFLAVSSQSTDEVTRRVLEKFRASAANYLMSDGQEKALLRKTEIMAVTIGALANSACQTLDSIDVLAVQLNFYVLADCCYHLRHTPRLWQEIVASDDLLQRFHRHISRLQVRNAWPVLYGPQMRQLGLLLEFATPAHALTMLESFESMYPNPHNKTQRLPDKDLLRLVDFYTTLAATDGALRALSKVSPSLLQSPDRETMGRCVNLLLLDRTVSGHASHNFRVLPTILDLGVPPLDIVHNLVVQNTAKSGLLQVAFDLLHYLQTDQIAVHGQTYSVLLKCSFESRDVDAIDKLFTILHASEELSHNPWLLASTINIVRCICFFDRNQGPAACFRRVLQIYDRAYSRHALVELGICDASDIDDSNTDIRNPHPVALSGIMLAYVLVQRDVRVVDQLWQNLKQLLGTSNPIATDLLRVPGTFRAFLIFYSRPQHKSTKEALGVLEYLLSNYPEQLKEIEWCTVLAGLIRAGGHEMAVQIKRIMLRTGTKFTLPGTQFLREHWPSSTVVQKILRDIDDAGLLDSQHVPDVVADIWEEEESL